MIRRLEGGVRLAQRGQEAAGNKENYTRRVWWDSFGQAGRLHRQKGSSERVAEQAAHRERSSKQASNEASRQLIKPKNEQYRCRTVCYYRAMFRIAPNVTELGETKGGGDNVKGVG